LKDDTGEIPGAAGFLDHHAIGIVLVGGHDDACLGAKAEVPEFVAS
jgi:hypothetical protein